MTGFAPRSTALPLQRGGAQLTRITSTNHPTRCVRCSTSCSFAHAVPSLTPISSPPDVPRISPPPKPHRPANMGFGLSLPFPLRGTRPHIKTEFPTLSWLLRATPRKLSQLPRRGGRSRRRGAAPSAADSGSPTFSPTPCQPCSVSPPTPSPSSSLYPHSTFFPPTSRAKRPTGLPTFTPLSTSGPPPTKPTPHSLVPSSHDLRKPPSACTGFPSRCSRCPYDYNPDGSLRILLRPLSPHTLAPSRPTPGRRCWPSPDFSSSPRGTLVTDKYSWLSLFVLLFCFYCLQRTPRAEAQQHLHPLLRPVHELYTIPRCVPTTNPTGRVSTRLATAMRACDPPPQLLFQPRGRVSLTPWDPDCLLIVTTSLFESAACELPPHCGATLHTQLEHHWYGTSTTLCYAHPDRFELYGQGNDYTDQRAVSVEGGYLSLSLSAITNLPHSQSLASDLAAPTVERHAGSAKVNVLQLPSLTIFPSIEDLALNKPPPDCKPTSYYVDPRPRPLRAERLYSAQLTDAFTKCVFSSDWVPSSVPNVTINVPVQHQAAPAWVIHGLHYLRGWLRTTASHFSGFLLDWFTSFLRTFFLSPTMQDVLLSYLASSWIFTKIKTQALDHLLLDWFTSCNGL
ncbi:capsid protein [Sogatella furcifera hepe-like virus]|uniref:capsid protein n=1 Tax=Sogatella furcifera hepe-like virus TaxID=2152923 RepID=UPI000D20A812|nr:capsid protein [Sogatella furcifera hepe-like virus]AVV61532.1 capsid protein [Sogatella furcifera hepe-like virus]